MRQTLGRTHVLARRQSEVGNRVRATIGALGRQGASQNQHRI